MELQPYSPEVISTAIAIAGSYQVSPKLHNKDFILRHSLESSSNGSEEVVKGYFNGGYKDASQLIRTIGEFKNSVVNCKILEFASGYGRVTRHLSKLLPNNNVTACDVHHEAVDFIRQNLDCSAKVSSVNPDLVNLEDKYDVISVMSLFSHLPDATFGRFLSMLERHLEPEGIIIFTTHGDFAWNKYPFLVDEYDQVSGFGYKNMSEQKDLDVVEYGLTVSNMNYVANAVKNFTKLHPLKFRSGVWFGLQDEWVIGSLRD
jgi:SAM-dependent methyltransferase